MLFAGLNINVADQDPQDPYVFGPPDPYPDPLVSRIRNTAMYKTGKQKFSTDATGPHLEPVETLQGGVPPLGPVLERFGVCGQLPLLLPVCGPVLPQPLAQPAPQALQPGVRL